jgi:hypothetical protein
MFLRKFQRKFLTIIMLAMAFPLIALLVSRLNDPEIIKEPLPSPLVYKTTPTPKVIPTQSKLPVVSPQLAIEVNLDIPFTSQAPNQNWVLPYKEFCEEASVLMVMSYVNRQLISTHDYASQKMLEIKAFEEKRFGYYQDTNAEETAIIMREFYNYSKIKIVYNPTIEDIKMALAEGRAVIMPAAGRMLGNPYFQVPGPLYHMIVIKGYTKTGNFITNDPGTRHGADFIYAPNVLMNANHDWNNGDVNNGRKVVIIVG